MGQGKNSALIFMKTLCITIFILSLCCLEGYRLSKHEPFTPESMAQQRAEREARYRSLGW
jgi:hypothetical protein